jgi:glycosyltransferase involved in cell wall biosynthesis
VRLLVVGNDNPEAFRRRAAQLGVENRCRWESSKADVLDFYATADAYVSPSREDSFGLPVAEAMACGLPAITSVSAGVSDYIRDGVDGFVLREPRDAQALARLVARLQVEPDLCSNVGEAAAQKILEFDWNRNAAAVWELLQQAAKTSRRSV